MAKKKPISVKVNNTDRLEIGMKITVSGPTVPPYMEGHQFTVEKIHQGGNIDLSDFPVSKKRAWLKKHPMQSGAR